MSIKGKVIKLSYKKSIRVTAGVMVVVFFVTMVLQSATLVAISRSNDKTEAAVNYLAENTEYVNKNRAERVIDYLETLVPEETLEDYYTLAGIHIAREEYAEALENIEKCIALYNNEGRELYLDLLLKRGCLLVMLKRYDEALKSLDMALAENPSAADVYLVKAQIYAERQNMEKLTECLKAYALMRPEDTVIRELLAQALFSEGDYEAATQQYEAILQTNPSAEIEYLYGLSAVRESDFAAAETALTSAISKDDSFDGIYYYRGVCRMSLGDYAGAVEDMTISIDRDDMVHASYYTRGICLLMNNEFEKGLADIQYAAGLSDDPEITKQAEEFLAQLEAAQSAEDVPAETVIPEETIQPEALLPPVEQSVQGKDKSSSNAE